ncbi:MAG: hypothetical protein HY720_13420 [Planctomycetes bacterium]|nr:hypothetical protein [Planctomycetota bacterium]
MTKIHVAALAVALAVGLGGSAWAATAQELWPAQAGNTWTYEVSGQIGNGTTHEAKVVATSGGWSKIEGFEGTHWWYMSGQSGRVWVWNESAGNYSLVFDLGLAKGAKFTMNFPGATCLDKTTWTVAEKNATLDTEVGTFTGCVVLALVQSPCADAGLGEVAFAPGVGIVRTSSQSIAGPKTSNVIHALVNGAEYKRKKHDAGLTACVTVDKAVYELWINRMPSIGPVNRPPRPDTMTVEFRITNNTRETIQFDYRSGQKYDFVIKNEADKELYRWSAGRAFTMALTRDTLRPGESLVFTEKLELRESQGLEGVFPALGAGKYAIEAIHTTSSTGHRLKARVPFHIVLRVAY